MIRVLIWLLGGLLVALGVLLLAGYTFFSQMAGWLGPVFAQGSPVQVLELVAERPDLRGIEISRLRLAGNGYLLDAEGLEARYRFSELIRARFDSLVIERLDVEYATTGSKAEKSARTVAPDSEAAPVPVAALESIFSSMPFTEVRIPAVSLRLPELGLAASGALVVDQQSLRGALAASEPEVFRDFLLDLELHRNGEIHGTFGRAPMPDRPFLSVHSRVPDDRLEIEAQVNLEGANLDLAAYMLDLPEGQGNVQGDLQIAYPWPLDTSATAEQVSMEGSVSVDWLSRDGQIRLSGLKGPLRLMEGLLEWFPAQQPEPQPRLPPEVLPEALPEAPGALISWQAGSTRAAFAPEALVYSLPDQRLTTEGVLQAFVEGEADAGLPTVQYRGPGSLSVWVDGASTHFQAALVGSLHTLDREFPLDIEVNAGMTDVLLAELTLTSGIVRKLDLGVRYPLAGGPWSLNADHTLAVSEPLIAAIWPGWKQPFDLEGGTIRLLLMLGGRDSTDLTGTLQMDLNDVAAFYQNTVLRGVYGTLNGRLQSGEFELLTSPIRIRLLDFGVPVSAIETRLAGNPDRLSLGETRGGLLGGSFLLRPFDYLPASGSGEMRLELEGLDLAAVLALEGDDITGTGRLDGVLPITISQNQVSVSGGELQARPPGGAIRLNPAVAGALTQPGLDVALGALTDFQYQVLTGRANYNHLGDLELGIGLEGRSPLVENGRPIHFNLNVSENIPVLLESLRLQDEFTRRIEQKVRR